MNLTTKKSAKNVYGVAYVNWRGEWVSEKQTFTSKTKAETFRKSVAQKKALNGQATVFIAN